ncbi:MAG: alpha/beta hydrolase [Sterolibacterium sp.]|nr:alpha/beta hydrolase [Sterolibacterium sp.]
MAFLRISCLPLICSLLASHLLAACISLPSLAERRELADTLAAAHHWQATMFSTDRFDLLAYLPQQTNPVDELTIYIEGDGFAWQTPATPSPDPTPRNPLALRLALNQPEGTAIYLARPCQYTDAVASGCNERYWTEQRFANDVILATSQAIDKLKSRFNAQRLTLVGYSGGGAVATLVAARRDDVRRLITLAGNLDHRAWTTHHRLQPLAGSLNPANVSPLPASIQQTHLVGGKDRIIPVWIAQNFSAAYEARQRPVVRIIDNYDHNCCWADDWPQLWRSLQQEKSR